MFELEIKLEQDVARFNTNMYVCLVDHKNGCYYDKTKYVIDMDRPDTKAIMDDYIRMYKQTLIECGVV